MGNGLFNGLGNTPVTGHILDENNKSSRVKDMIHSTQQAFDKLKQELK